jgi:hypothetical protein
MMPGADSCKNDGSKMKLAVHFYRYSAISNFKSKIEFSETIPTVDVGRGLIATW